MRWPITTRAGDARRPPDTVRHCLAVRTARRRPRGAPTAAAESVRRLQPIGRDGVVVGS